MNPLFDRRIFVLGPLVLFGMCMGTPAQVPTGTIVGTVKDAQGLTIAEAAVTLTNEGTANTLTGTTSSLGVFEFTQINFGIYKVEVSKPGFKIGIVTGIRLDASTEYSVPPIVLEVGPVADTITVEADAEMVRTTGAELTETIERKQIEDLPILDRNPLNLLSLEAGVTQNNRNPNQIETVINGQRQSFSDMTLDGINIQDNYIRSNSLDYTPNLLLISQTGEFTITTQNAGPQAGEGSSQVSIVTPSGTNNWHGEGFWYYRTDDWAANYWFNDKNGVAKPNLLQNQAGGDIGGPVVKKKVFIYGAYELLRLREQVPTPTVVLTPLARDGYFQWLDTTSNIVKCAQIVVVPGAPSEPNCPSFPGVTNPSANSVMLNLLNQVPTTINDQSIGDGLNTGGYLYNQAYNNSRDNTSVRVDWIPAAHHSFTGTYAWNRELLERPGSSLGLPDTYNPIPSVFNNDKENFLSVAWRWSPNSNFTNEVRFGFDLAPINFQTNQNFGAYTISGTIFNNPNQNEFPSSRSTHTWSWQDNATWSHGNHLLAFGIQVQRVTIFAENFANAVPNLTIGDSYSASALGSQVGVSDAALQAANGLLASLAGIIWQDTQTFNATSRTSGYVPGAPMAQNFSYDDWSLYFGDSWKLRKNLTLTYGVRWEYYSPFNERDGLLVLPVASPGQTIQQTLISDATLGFFGGNTGRLPYNKELDNFAPNIGIAWDPFGDGKTSIRAGYSLNYVNDELVSAPYNAALSNPGVSFQASNSYLTNNTVSNFPAISAPGFYNTFSGNWANLYGYETGLNYGYAVDPNLRTPYVQQWNLSVQREIGWNTSLTVSYVGNKGSRLYRAIDLNQVQINGNGFLQAFNALRQNGFLAQAATGTFNSAYNPSIPGSQNVTYFNNNFLYGDLSVYYPALVNQYLQQGAVGDLANLYHGIGSDSPALYNYYGVSGTPVSLAPNQYLEGADLLGNFASSIYNAGSVEIRRRFRQGLTFQASYTFSKVMTNYSADTYAGAERFSALLDNANPGLEWARADFDLTHAFKANFVYQLPIGRGHMWSPENSVLNQLVSGWTLSSIITWQSGPPFSILSGEGTLNYTGRSIDANTAYTTSSVQQIAGQLGVQNGPNGEVALINPRFIGPNGLGAPNDALTCNPVTSGGFCNPAPGTVGNLPRNAFNGPPFFNLDLGIHKDFQINESKTLEYRVEMFNALNHPTFAVGDASYAVSNPGASSSDIYINDPNFGVATSTASNPRVIQMGLRLLF